MIGYMSSQTRKIGCRYRFKLRRVSTSSCLEWGYHQGPDVALCHRSASCGRAELAPASLPPVLLRLDGCQLLHM